jgi:D-3-phosphoglycerate dehydrogenase
VFNSPFSNSRSVAELVIGEIIMLARQLGDRNIEMHNGVWNKVSKACYEIRGKILGIVGYGHIGAQLSVLAEAMGMTVYFYDVLQIMPLGQAKPLESLDELLAIADYVSVHVPETEDTKNMIGEHELKQMKDGAYLLNNARGTVVQIPALTKALQSGRLAGACIDVFPKEPASNGSHFDYYPELLSCKNLILTPHIGGSTEEAQRMIGLEVSQSLTKYINDGTSLNAVNFPEIDLRAIREDDKNTVRVLYIHQNIPGVLRVSLGIYK